jgi:hypothetical protein
MTQQPDAVALAGDGIPAPTAAADRPDHQR